MSNHLRACANIPRWGEIMTMDTRYKGELLISFIFFFISLRESPIPLERMNERVSKSERVRKSE